jgi:hypothetical protein
MTLIFARQGSKMSEKNSYCDFFCDMSLSFVSDKGWPEPPNFDRCGTPTSTFLPINDGEFETGITVAFYDIQYM